MHELTVAAETLRHVIRRTWWIPLIQGLAAIVIGLSLVTRPAPTLVILTMFLGAYWLVGGVFDGVGALARRGADRHWGLALLSGVLGAIAGTLLLTRPVLGFAVTSTMIVALIAAMAILSGVMSVVWAVRVRKEIQGEGWIVLFGLLSIAMGVVLLSSPVLSAVALVQFAAVLAIVGGVGGVVNALRLRRAVS